ncbi:MAG: cellulase family glycosylhydrolase [Acidobacteriota bacterium]|nr:cellulase family glycosylhydrolase [Acidobacteriota bacterium]
MSRTHSIIMLAALALIACVIFLTRGDDGRGAVPPGFVATRGVRFEVDGRPFRFVGANAAVVYGDDERARMPVTLRESAQDGVRVIRVWAFGEVEGEGDGADANWKSSDWLSANPFRRGPDGWNEAAFVNLDRVIAEAARHHQRVQLCLVNWWPDTGGVTQYLRWAGVTDAYDVRHPHGVNVERAMEFYSNEQTRRLYREHVERVVLRRNTVTGRLYRDDPTIMAYELMNEAQSPTGRWAERRAWVAEMSAFIKSLDPHHLVTPGTWGYRTAWERRAWVEEHRLPTVDYCDVHVYPRDDHDSYVNSPDALREFIDNRAAAAFSVDKPLVIGEFGMTLDGFAGVSQAEWFRAYFENAARAGVSGAMFWIWTHATERDYGVSYVTPRDDAVRAEFARAAKLFDTHAADQPPAHLLDAGRHLVPRQFVFACRENDETTQPAVKIPREADISATERAPESVPETDGVIYQFSPEQAVRGRFEKLGGGVGYVWGAGVGFFEYVLPARGGWRRGAEVNVRAHLQPDLPFDANGRVTATRVTLFVNGNDCGARLVPIEKPPAAIIQEWRIDSQSVRSAAARGEPLTVRFAVEPDADLPAGLNISNFPEGFDPRGATPIEVIVR